MSTDYRRIGPEEFEPHEEQLLLDECSKDPFGVQMQHLKDDLSKGLMAAYRWTGDFSGLLIVRTFDHPAGRELAIWHISGRGFLEHIKEVRRLTRRLARELDCKWISAEARSPVLARIYARLSKVSAVKFLMEA